MLVASPTGTGKTFAAFLSVLDALDREHEAGKLRDTIYCIYVSPLRALGYDLEKNLRAPLREIYGEKPPIRVELRSGDTSASQRARQFSKPPASSPHDSGKPLRAPLAGKMGASPGQRPVDRSR